MSYTLLLDHPQFVVVDKPVGVSVHSEDGPGLVVQLSEQLNCPLYLVHRLDKVTSGVLLLARSASAAAELSAQFAEHRVQKYYLAIAGNKPKKKQGWVKGDMDKARRGAFKLLPTLHNPAVTQFFSQAIAPGFRGYLLKPRTGKTHQLRVALKSLGVPIYGDELYGGSAFSRVCLHAYQLHFSFAATSYCVTAPLPAAFAELGLKPIVDDVWAAPDNLPWPE